MWLTMQVLYSLKLRFLMIFETPTNIVPTYVCSHAYAQRVASLSMSVKAIFSG